MKTHEKILVYLKRLKQPPKKTVDERSEPGMFFNSVGWGREGRVGKLIIEKEEVNVPLREGMTQEELLEELERTIARYSVLVRR